MAVYLGSSGYVTLQRAAEGQFYSELDAGDVNPGTSRFSFDFPQGTFITGDKLAIRRLDAGGGLSTSPLDFVDGSGWDIGAAQPDGAWYVHVDPIGGIRLYRTWADSLTGSQAKAIQLHAPSATYPISVAVDSQDSRCLAQIQEYTLSTERASLDVTSLGDTFAQNISGLISGSGTLNCLWDWAPALCRESGVEYVQYLHQLILRQQVGSEFKAELVLKRRNEQPLDADLDARSSGVALMYVVTGVVTAVGLSVTPDEPLESTIDFVTTGDIQMRYDVPSGDLILQENADRIFLEDGSSFLAQDFNG